MEMEVLFTKIMKRTSPAFSPSAAAYHYVFCVL